MLLKTIYNFFHFFLINKTGKGAEGAGQGPAKEGPGGQAEGRVTDSSLKSENHSLLGQWGVMRRTQAPSFRIFVMTLGSSFTGGKAQWVPGGRPGLEGIYLLHLRVPFPGKVPAELAVLPGGKQVHG